MFANVIDLESDRNRAALRACVRGLDENPQPETFPSEGFVPTPDREILAGAFAVLGMRRTTTAGDNRRASGLHTKRHQTINDNIHNARPIATRENRSQARDAASAKQTNAKTWRTRSAVTIMVVAPQTKWTADDLGACRRTRRRISDN
jgi:hypothetical protein